MESSCAFAKRILEPKHKLKTRKVYEWRLKENLELHKRNKIIGAVNQSLIKTNSFVDWQNTRE